MRLNASWSRLSACAALVLLAFAPASRATVNVGVVLDVSGEWVLIERGKDSGLIRRGQAVTAGSLVRPRSGDGSVVIHLNNDRVIRCEARNLGECERPLALPKRSSTKGRFWAAVAYLIMRQPGVYVSVLARPKDEGAGELREAVVRVDGGKVDVGPAFAAMSPGRYLLRFDSVTQDGTKKRLGPVVFNRKQEAPSEVTVPGLTPGLYRILLLDEAKNNEPSGPDVWVLAADAAGFRQVSAQFSNASAWAGRWNSGESRDAERMFLRAYLDHLARPDRR